MSSGPTVLVAGMSVVVQRRDGRLWMRRNHHRMLELFTSCLRSYRLAAAEDFGHTGGTYDVPLDGVEVAIVNSGPMVGWERIRGTPGQYARLLALARGAGHVYARLPSWQGLAAIRAARLARRPYFVSLHGNWDEVFDPRDARGLARAYRLAMARYVARATRRALAGARHAFLVGEQLESLYAALCREPPTVFANYLHDRDEVWPAEVRERRGRARLLFVGELSRAKGVRVLVEALERLLGAGLDVELALVGVGPEQPWLEARAAEPALRGRLLVRGWRSAGPALDEEYRAADLFVLPSFAEGVPKVVVEAMVRGRPVVATDVGSIGHVLGGGERGWLGPPRDARAGASALELAPGRPAEGAAKRERATAWARTHDRRWALERVRSGLGRVDPAIVR